MKIGIIICARIDSKRLPKKNILELCGKPLIRWSIDFGNLLGYQVNVLTRDPAIMNNCSGAYIIFEPIELYDIEGNIMDKLRYVNSITDCDYLVDLQATSPIRDIDQYEYWINHVVEYEIQSAASKYKDRLNGGFFMVSREYIETKNKITDKNTLYFQDSYGFDIDTAEDFAEVERWMSENKYYT